MDKDREFKAETERVEARSLAKGKRHARKAAIGETMTIRMGGNRKISGAIESVTCDAVTWGGRSCYALFSVVLVCGTAKIRRTVNVKRIPTF